MRFKIVNLIALLGFSAFFAACGGSDLSEPLERNYETLTGEFQSLGSVKVNKTITHLFETDDGNILYAYSDRYDLNDDEYKDMRVEAYGVVMTFEGVDQEVFEIRRVTEADEEDEEDANVSYVTYKDSELAFSIVYPDNWDFSALRDSIRLDGPMPDLEEESDDESEKVAENVDFISPDYIVIASLGNVLSTDDEDSQTDRANDIKAYAEANYENLAGVSSQLTYIGEDQEFAVRYKTDDGSISYFVPLGGELFDLGFYHPSVESDIDLVKNTNTFSEIVAGFKFIGEGDELSDDSDNTDDTKKVDEPVEGITVEEPANTPVSIPGYREFESNPFKFIISYPSSWYFSGGSGGYDFNDEPIEDDTDPLIRLDLNVATSEGTSTSGGTTKVTVKVGDRYYTLSGPSEYAEVMQTMADSIKVVEE